MEEIISTLEQLVPIIIIVTLTIFMSLETWIPFLQHSTYRKKQRWHNIGNLIVSFVLNASLSGVIAYSITRANEMQFGLLYQLPISKLLFIIIGVMLCDLNGYVAHRLYHKIPLLWRFHRVHHSDIELDSTSALRLHPFEFIFQAATQATVLPLLGVSNVSFVLYSTFAVVLFIVNHCNIKFPQWYERGVSLVLVTPNWHRVHHSSFQPDTDSNFSDVFTFWDRIFRTQKIRKPEEIHFGLEEMRDPKSQSFLGMLKTPFLK
ncbi:MAG: sterol desaturase family protein [Bacteroidota bacterium]